MKKCEEKEDESLKKACEQELEDYLRTLEKRRERIEGKVRVKG